MVVSTGRGDELKIICDPFCRARSDDDVLMYYNCHDVFDLGIIPRGRWTFVPRFYGAGDNYKLVLQLTRQGLSGSKRVRESRTITFPLYFDNGTNSIHVGTRNGGIIDDDDTPLPPFPAVSGRRVPL